MANRSLIKQLFGPVPAILLSLLLLGALYLLVASVQNAEASAEIYSALLAVTLLGLVSLCALIIGNLWRLWRQRRANVLGSRLTLRLVGVFALLVVVPMSMLYYFAFQFLSKGIDSWFDVKVEQAVDNALLLGQTSLEVIKREALEEVRDAAARLKPGSSRETVQLLNELRQRHGYQELTLYSESGRIIASSSQEAQSLILDTPDESILAQIRIGGEYVSLEPIDDGGQQLRVGVTVPHRAVGEPARVLQAVKLVPLRYARLAESIERASNQYKQMVISRGPLKYSLILSLTLVTLVAMLLAAWVAIFIARRMAAPLKDLAEGTRAVAEGNYRKELPVTSGDEFGVLVKSFNDMTRRINRAQSAARRSQREAEQQRAYLETILGHLSSGVLAFDRRHQLLTHNHTAGGILGIDLQSAEGETLADLQANFPQFEPLFAPIADAMERGLSEWQSEVAVFGAQGRQVLIVRGTQLPRTDHRFGGYVVVFDDVTDLIRAQRDAAWGEVARRLAHEIKNPLTPIQLSAERIRNKYLDKLKGDERATLDRATRTIAAQVESMKSMVNAFSSYAQPVSMQLRSVKLNQLVQDVVELHRQDERPIPVTFKLDPQLPALTADDGRLRQVLNNLLINARDALIHSEQPRIEITTRSYSDKDQNFVELVVEDNGPGIPDNMLERLFEPYVTTKERGTGLGLAIVKRIIEEHGGTIWAANLRPSGTRVVVRLPVAARRSEQVTDLRMKPVRARIAGGKAG